MICCRTAKQCTTMQWLVQTISNTQLVNTRTHGEAYDLVVPRCFCFFHRLHERPGILVTLKHIKQCFKKTVCLCTCVSDVDHITRVYPSPSHVGGWFSECCTVDRGLSVLSWRVKNGRKNDIKLRLAKCYFQMCMRVIIACKFLS